MSLAPKIRRAIAKRLSSIKNDKFDQDTIKLLLIELREELPPDSILKEIAHFVAHPTRDRGMILEVVDYTYNRARVLFEQLGDKNLNIDLNNIPNYLYSTIFEHYKRVQPDEEKRNKLGQSFKQNEDGSYSLVGQFESELNTIIKDALKVLAIQPALTQEEIINELCTVLKASGFNDSVNFVREKSDGLSLCILSMLHQTYFELPDGNIASAQIINDQFLPDKKAKIKLAGKVKPNSEKSAILFPLIESEIDAKKYFANNMVIQPEEDIPFLASNYDENSHLETIRNNEGILLIAKIE